MVQAINTVNSPVDIPSALTNLPQDNPQEILSFALKQFGSCTKKVWVC
ncbi:hypothetical protein AM1_4089 [Acaryochloris marina MBIC11017]|uniref:Uncharacterized protein n=1 Tax=Acaryochloris marina (strain MBIC 11017) TaxID=329726 RepID=B0CAK4_ACAM1|nr:hypothetical protein AM1_4089 [Acaryochloris marina MBIC11017]